MRKLFTCIAAAGLAFAGSANATTIFDPLRVADARQVITFGGLSTLADSTASFSFADGLGTFTTSGVSFGSASAYTFGNTGNTSLGINGTWGNGASYLSFDKLGEMTMTISFGGKTTRSFGALWGLYEQEGDNRALTVEAFDKNGRLLESFSTATEGIDVEDNPLAGTWNNNFFQGIRRRDADIATIKVTGDRIVMDNFTFTTLVSAVPEPAGSALFLAGLGVVGAVSRRRFRA